MTGGSLEGGVTHPYDTCPTQRERAIGKSVADYEAELRRLATHCDFGEYLDQAL